MHIGFTQQVYKLEFAEGSAPRTTLSFRTSAHAGVGISIDFRAAYRHTGRSILPFPGICPRKVVLLSGGLPRQCAHWLAMIRNLIARQIPIFHFAAASLYAKKLKYEALPGFPGRALLCLRFHYFPAAPMRIWARAESPSRMTVFSSPLRLCFRASRARVNS